MRESITVKVCTKYEIGISCISLKISLHVESIANPCGISIRVIKCMRGDNMFRPLCGKAPLPRNIT